MTMTKSVNGIEMPLTPDEVADVLARQAALIPTFADLKGRKLGALAACRWQAETGGITLFEMPIKTDDDTQRKITGAYVQADKNPAFTARWKMATGVFVTLDASTLIAIGDAVAAHIQACFDKEGDLTALIVAAEDDAALEAIDIEAGWPG